jgi:hypothetical protein
MRTHRNPRQRLAKRPSSDNFGTLDDLLGLLKDNIGKAHAFISSAEYQMEQAPSGDDEKDLRRKSDVEHLVEAGKLAVQAAAYTAEEIETAIARKRSA